MSSQKSAQPIIPTWKLERYLLGELPPKEMLILQKQINDNLHLQLQLETLQKSNADFLNENDPKQSARRILALSGAKKEFAKQKEFEAETTIKSWWGTVLSMPMQRVSAVFLALFAAVIVWQISHQSALPVNEIRTKGLNARIELWQKEGDSVALILDSAQLKKDDLVQIRIHPASRCFAAVVSIDGRGNWTTHLPATGPLATYVEPGKNEFLPFSYQLDDAPNYEVFWLISAEAPFHVDSLIQSLESLRGSPFAPPVLPLDARFTQARISIRK